MNKRIKELARQAGGDILMNDDGSGIDKEDGMFFDLESFEKFTQSIIQECAEVADNADATREKWQNISLFIKQYFGVKE
jgi:hypothetical protein